MTENEAIKEIKRWTEILLRAGSQCTMETAEAQDMAIKALEEVQQYRALGTPEDLKVMKEHGGFTGVELAQIAAGQMKLKEYQTIGTPEECRAAREKQTPKRPIGLDMCTCPSCYTQNEIWKKRRNIAPNDIVYCWHCGQAVEILREDGE